MDWDKILQITYLIKILYLAYKKNSQKAKFKKSNQKISKSHVQIFLYTGDISIYISIYTSSRVEDLDGK